MFLILLILCDAVINADMLQKEKKNVKQEHLELLIFVKHKLALKKYLFPVSLLFILVRNSLKIIHIYFLQI